MMMTLHPLRPRATVAALALLLGAPALGAAIARPAAAAAAGDARFTVAPAANGFGAGRADYGFTLSPGGRVRDGVVVANRGTAPLRLTLGTADGVTTPEGRLGLSDRAPRRDGVGAWVRLGQTAITVEPGASITVPFTIAPPEGAAAGDHVGGIVATAAGRRQGVPVRLRVSGPLKPALAVQDVHVDYAGTANPAGTGDATITYTIRNTGNAILGARQAVSASGPLGTFARRAAKVADAPPLLPGATWKATAAVRDVAPALRLTATVRLTPLLADAAGSIAPLPVVEATGHAPAIPWSLLLALAVAGGVAVAVALRVRRRLAGAVALAVGLLLAPALALGATAPDARADGDPPRGAVGGIVSPASGTIVLHVRAADADDGLAGLQAAVDGVVVASADLAGTASVEDRELPVATTAFGDGAHQLQVSATDTAGHRAVLADQPIVINNTPPARQSTVALTLGTSGPETPPDGAGTGGGASSGGGAGTVGGSGGTIPGGGPACRSPRLSMFLKDKPLRVAKGVPVLRRNARYRFGGTLTCVVAGRRVHAPRGVVVALRNQIGRRVYRKRGVSTRSDGALSIILSYPSSRVLEFRYTSIDGTTARVRLRIAVVAKTKEKAS